MSKNTKLFTIIIAIIGAAIMGWFLAVQFLVQPVNMPHQQGIQVGPSQEEQGFPVSFRSMSTIHSAEMEYGVGMYSSAFIVESYLWEFGDGETSTEANPAHIYKQAGTYTVRLTITSTDGKTYTETTIIEVK